MDRSAADDLSPEVRAGWEALRLRFLAGLPQRWQEIAAAPDASQQAAVLHRLAGVAGSYGCAALGEAARSAEQHALAGDSPDLAAALVEVKRLIDAADDRSGASPGALASP